jgi:arylsulfatase A
MGYGDLAIQNPESKIPTPNLDQLAREGLRFTDAHSSSGICTPSRYALLTGRYHWRKFHSIVNSFGGSRFDDDRLTLPEMLRQRGYRTACIGKWHLGWNWEAIKRPGAKPETLTNDKKGFPPDAFDWTKSIPGGPLAHGFDYYFGDDVPNFPPYAWIENDRVLEAPTLPLTETPTTAEGRWEARPGPMTAGWDLAAVMPRLTQRCVDWIAAQKDQSGPFFLYFPFTSPHAPIVPTKQFVDSSDAGGYGDFVLQSDWSAGQVLQALDARGLRKNTLVIFTSDNGPEIYAYDRIANYDHRSMGPLRGAKRDIWEGGHRVPMLVRWPGETQPGRVSDALVSQIDVMATIASIIDFPLPIDAAEDSVNLLPLWRDATGGEKLRTSHVHNTNRDHYAVRDGDWVLVDAKSGSLNRLTTRHDRESGYAENTHSGALFNLGRDLPQRENLFAMHPDKVAAMRALLEKTREQGHSAPRLAE